MTESSETSDTPAKPQDYASLRTELAKLVNDFTPVISKLWPRLGDHRYRWELHSYGLPEGHDKQVVSDVIDMLTEALKGTGVADNKLLKAHTKVDHHNPSNPQRRLISRHLIPKCLTSRSAGSPAQRASVWRTRPTR